MAETLTIQHSPNAAADAATHWQAEPIILLDSDQAPLGLRVAPPDDVGSGRAWDDMPAFPNVHSNGVNLIGAYL